MATAFIFMAFFVLLFVGAPIALALGGSALLYMFFFASISPSIVAQQMLSQVNSYMLLAVPFFVMAGALMESGGISRRIIDFSKALVGHFTGGLALVVILASVFFAAMTGSGVAATAAVGGIMLPAMFKSGYDEDFSCALQATAGIFGPLIPPSIVMVLYATTSGESVSSMLLAGVGPGVLQAGLVAAFAVYVCHKNHYKGEGTFKISKVISTFKSSFWALLVPIIILGGIYSGMFTPTEASGVACFYSIIVGLFVYKELNFKSLFFVLAKAMKSAAGIMLIVGASGAFSWVLTKERIPKAIAEMFLSFTNSSVVFLLVAVFILLIAGCFIDSVPIVTIFTPILVPIALEYDISLVHLGAVMVSSTCVGLITPPMGLNLFMASQIGNRPTFGVINAAKSFVLITVIGLLLVVFVPAISTYLPTTLL